MEDYNEIPFKEMLGKKIEKNNSERGAKSFGFSLHGGKPIKELYRTVYTGGDDEGYCKDPVIDPKVVQTNAEGATKKTMKSDTKKGYPSQEDVKNNPDIDFSVTDDGQGGLAVSGDTLEHSEKSIRDMITEKNITGFVKAGFSYRTKGDHANKMRAQAEDAAKAEDAVEYALANREASEFEEDAGDALDEEGGNTGTEVYYHEPDSPMPVVSNQMIGIANDIQDDPSQSLRSFVGGDPVTKEKVVNSSLNERDDRIFNPQDHEPPVWKQNSGAYADAMIGTNRV